MSVKNALVVDDTPANLDFLERLMTQAGFTVHGASTGEDALTIIKAQESIMLALVDMQLPDMNGLDLTRHVRQAHPDAYIVVATMHDERSLMQQVFVRGGNCFLVKPHGFMELFKRLTTQSITELLQRDEHTVIDQYGPRVYRLATN